MASTLPHPSSSDKPMFIPPQKRRTASGRTGTFTPASRSAPKSVVYGDQILNVQVSYDQNCYDSFIQNMKYFSEMQNIFHQLTVEWEDKLFYLFILLVNNFSLKLLLKENIVRVDLLVPQ